MPPAIAGPSTAAISGLVSRKPLSSALITDGSNSPDSKLSPGWLRAHRLQVGAGAEVAAGAGEDADPDLGVVVHPVPGLAHDREHLAGERVARLGPVHRDDQLVAVLLDEAVRLRRRLVDSVISHRGSLAENENMF